MEDSETSSMMDQYGPGLGSPVDFWPLASCKVDSITSSAGWL
jgi:hypothetical protein